MQGKYEVTPGLFRFGADFGNGTVDTQLFQIDGRFGEYRAGKLAARREDLAKYVCTDGLSDGIAGAVNAHLAQRLATEHPTWFCIGSAAHGGTRLDCALTGESLLFDSGYALRDTRLPDPVTPPYAHALDALACQLQEDLAVIVADAQGDRICAIHLCFPNHWAPRDKIGRSFHTIHAPVPGMAPVNRKAAQLVAGMIHKGPFVRFAWGLATDARLNHHPAAPRGEDPGRWAGRCFDAAHPRLYLRVERQTSVGFPEVNAALFTIRTYFYPVAALRRERDTCTALLAAIESMSDAQLAYKGLARDRTAILAWLRDGRG